MSIRRDPLSSRNGNEEAAFVWEIYEKFDTVGVLQLNNLIVMPFCRGMNLTLTIIWNKNNHTCRKVLFIGLHHCFTYLSSR